MKPDARVQLDLDKFAKKAVRDGPLAAFADALYNLLVCTNDIMKSGPEPKKPTAKK